VTSRRLEIQPEPTDAERRAIEIALAAERQAAARQPAGWLDAPDDGEM
jgi:hypothetical protein